MIDKAACKITAYEWDTASGVVPSPPCNLNSNSELLHSLLSKLFYY